jgi:hypothetical protein
MSERPIEDYSLPILWKRIAELEADVHAQSLAKHQAYETIKCWETKYAELEAKLRKYVPQKTLVPPKEKPE